MHRRKIEFAGLLACIVVAVSDMTAQDKANVTAPGSITSDGFTVSAVWHVTRTYKYVVHSKAGVRGQTGVNGVEISPGCPPGAPINTFETAKANAYVTEEVNKTKGQLRAAVRGDGNWHWKYDHQSCDPSSSRNASASGGFIGAVIHYDEQSGQAMVHFSVGSAPPANYQDQPGVPWPKSGTFSCDVPFQAQKITYRREYVDSGSGWQVEDRVIITRTEQEIEAEIKPGAGFKDWVPTMTGALPFEARVVSPPDLPVQWKISLYNVSNLPGVCGNADMPPSVAAQWQNRIKKNDYDLIFDFRKYGKTDTRFTSVDEPWQVLETKNAANDIKFEVNCLDYGASGRVLAMARVPGAAVAAKYKETGETFVRIPYSKSKSDKHRIADAAKPDGINTPYPADKPDEDQDDAHSKYPGDGLSVFDEYRGFVCKSGFAPGPGGFKHVRLDPQKRDLFVFTDGFSEELAPNLPAFAHASGLNVHWLGDDDDGFVRACDSSSRNHWVVNFNSDQAKEKPQHALYLLEDRLAEGIGGETCPDADCDTTDVGSPKDVYWIKVDAEKCRQIESDFPRMAGQLRRVVIHELGHGVGIHHHGDLNEPHIAVEGGQNSGDVNCAMKYVLWRFYRHKRSATEPAPQNHIYDPDNKERLGFAFCTSPIGNDYNKIGAAGWQCGNAVRGNCLAQIRVNDTSATPQGGKRASGKDVTDPGGDTTAPPNDDVEKKAYDSQKRAGVALGLRLRDQREIIPGEAMVIELSLHGGPSSERGSQWEQPTSSGKAQIEFGAKDHPWTDQVHFLMLDNKGRLVPFPAKYYVVGTAQRVDSSGRHEHADAKIELKPEATYLTAFAIDGSQTEGWTPGARRIFATMGSGQPGAADSITSKSVILSVVEPDKLPGPEQGARRKLSQGYVELAANHWAEAEKHARAAISEMPDSHKAWLLLAETLELQNNLKEAYAAYSEALTRYKPAKGVAEPPEVILAAVKSLEEKFGIHPEPPQIAAGPFAAHSLSAQSATGKLTPPFSKNASQLIFEWQLATPANDPLGVRWIAEEVQGVEKDHVIATAKSDPNKQSGRFSLSAPTAGFPPGKYRVEIWQTGKMIYSEKFEIKRE